MPSHSETRTLPYTPQQMYDLVADVGRYPEFLPWTAAARVRSRSPLTGAGGEHGELMEADLVISFKVFRERFGSRVELWPVEKVIKTEYLEGPFRHMHSEWRFEEAEGGCRVKFDVDFEFKNRILQRAAGLFFYEAMQRIVRAFEARAADLYGGGSPAAASSSDMA
ncbi:type II toxin-antitoxin system RatA family toxin [Rhodosalinus halophilus]|uniref:Type II toxin-antitoxin system RatA family toxin n=1 Tax=Rhodosalinus halophilus TaxID=2259333 RepID=A0A365U961_9RHOB|nr:type II toxin-antitoxin system RatA family toxin [Rhodosalinus halophilus]RBI85077.1 type II toxin-antitoxin system RatA family toxin [Rhodosalinus halophilus]